MNAFVEGTTFLVMTEPGQYYLFSETELPHFFSEWKIEHQKIESFEAESDREAVLHSSGTQPTNLKLIHI